MCGIFGVRRSWLAARGLAPATAAAAALRALRWRGPGAAVSVDLGDFTLGCARLSISEPRSGQPVMRRGGRFAAVLNGAITDARARFAALLRHGDRLQRLPNDAWLPLLLVERAALAELDALHGHRAAAVVDCANDTLVLVRDAMGEKPLFVARDERGRVVAFASTVPALQELVGPLDLSRATLAEFFARGTTSALHARSPGVAVAELASGVEVDGVALPARAAAVHGAVPLPLDRALGAAVARCAEAAVPVALCLSGGLDSSCLAAALQQQGRSLAAYQFQARGEPGDERARAREVAAHCKHRLREVDGGPDVLDALPRLTACHGLPLGDPSVLALHALACAAAQDGHRVLLSGEGADEALLGYARHRALRWLPRRGHAWLPQPRWSMRRSARMWRAAAARDPYAELLAVTPPAFRAEVLQPDAASQPELAVAGDRALSPLDRARIVDREVYLRRDLLPKLDVATMAAAIEGRCPFLDADVQAAALAIPARQALGKAPLRAAFARALPASVLTAKKRGFALPLDRWFRGELPWLDLLREPRTRQREHLRADGLDRAIDRHRRGGADLGHALYLVVAWELWLRSREENACA